MLRSDPLADPAFAAAFAPHRCGRAVSRRAHRRAELARIGRPLGPVGLGFPVDLACLVDLVCLVCLLD